MSLPEIPNQNKEGKDPLKDPLNYRIFKIIGVRGTAVSDEDLADYIKGVAAATDLSPEDIMAEISLARRDKET